MKNPKFRPNHKAKEEATNYANHLTHKDFCERCYAYNGKCPNTGKVAILDRQCKI